MADEAKDCRGNEQLSITLRGISHDPVKQNDKIDYNSILRANYTITAIYVHCFAHRLNLVICDVSKIVSYLSEFYSLVSKIYTYFHSSSVQQQLILGKINLFTTTLSRGKTVR
jgi:hypothetical protein